MTSRTLDLLLHCEWADAETWRVLLPLDVDEKCAGWMHHVHLVQFAFGAVWSGADLDLENLPEPGDHADLTSMAAWGRERHVGLQAAVSRLSHADLTREVTFPWTELVEADLGHPPEPVTVDESVLQVAFHSVHHRAQVAARLRELGHEPPALDYIRWLWRGRPRAGWPESVPLR